MAKTVNKADKEVILSNKIIYSNDFLVLYKSQRITNIFNELLIENDFKIIRGPWIVSTEEKL
jgi:hypothetical protein